MKDVYQRYSVLRLLDGNPTTLSTDDLRSTILSDSFSVDKDTRMAYVSSGNWIRRHLRGYFGVNSSQDTHQSVYSCDDNNAFVIQLYGLLPEFDTRCAMFFIVLVPGKI